MIQAPAEAAHEIPDSPYPGLTYYSEDEAAFFFGREIERKRLIASLRGSRFTLLYAESGVGKSSLLRAGLVRRLGEIAERNMAERGSPRYVPMIFSTWDSDPLGSLAKSVEKAARPFLGDGGTPGASHDGLEGAIHAAVDPLDARMLIIFDQFEEFFLYASNEAQAEFADQVARCVNDPDLRANFLISIRQDAYARLGNLFKGRIPNVYGSYLHLEALTVEAAREAIVKPLELFSQLHADGERFDADRDLVEEVLTQVRRGKVIIGEDARGGVSRHDGGPESRYVAAPYLQLVMRTLWEEETGAGEHTLRLATLDRLDGAEGIIRRHIDGAMSELPDPQQDAAAAALRYLVTPEGGKIALTAKGLGYFAGRSEEELVPLLRRLADKDVRILAVSAAPTERDGSRYEIFHDALAPSILDWRRRYVQAKERELQTQAEEEERERRVRAEEQVRAEQERVRQVQRQARRLRILVGCVLATAALAGLFLFQAHRQKTFSQSRELAGVATAKLASDPQLSMLLALEAVKKSRTPEAADALRAAISESRIRATLGRPQRGTGHGIDDAALSPDGRLAVTGSRDGKVRLWRSDGGGVLRSLPGHEAGKRIYTPEFTSDGRVGVTTGDDLAAPLWDIEGGSPGRFHDAYTAHFAPRGPFVVTTSADGSWSIWNVRSGNRVKGGRGPLPKPNDRVLDARISPTGTKLVAIGDRVGALWDLGTDLHKRGKPVPLRPGHDIVGTQFSPDGSLVLTRAKGTPTVKVWDARTGLLVTTIRGLRGQEGEIAAADFSPDSRLIVTAPNTVAATVWDAHTGARLGELQGHTDVVQDAEFARHPSNADQLVLTGADDRTARVWDIGKTLAAKATFLTGGERLVSVLHGSGSQENHARFDSSGERVIMAQDDGTASIFDAVPGEVTHIRPNLGDTATNVVNSVDSTGRAVTVEKGNTILIRDALSWRRVGPVIRRENVVGAGLSADGKVLMVLGPGPRQVRLIRLSAAADPARDVLIRSSSRALAFAVIAPDGQLVAIVGDEGSVELHRASDGLLVPNGRLRTGGGRLNDIALSPHSESVVASVTDGTGTLLRWERTNGRWKQRTTLREHTDQVLNTSFSDTGHYLVSAGNDARALVWDTRTWQVAARLTGQVTDVSDASFSADERFVVTSSSDGTVRLWDRATERRLAELDPEGGAVQAVSFAPDGRTIVTANQDGSVRTLNCEVCGSLDNVRRLAEQRLTATHRKLTPLERKQYLHEG